MYTLVSIFDLKISYAVSFFKYFILTELTCLNYNTSTYIHASFNFVIIFTIIFLQTNNIVLLNFTETLKHHSWLLFGHLNQKSFCLFLKMFSKVKWIYVFLIKWSVSFFLVCNFFFYSTENFPLVAKTNYFYILLF